MTKSEAISLLEKDFTTYCGIIEVLKNDKDCKLLYADTDGVVVSVFAGFPLIAVVGDTVNEKMLDVISSPEVLMTTSKALADTASKRFSLPIVKPCWQIVWDKTEKIPENPEIFIDKLSATDYNIKAVSETYTLGISPEGVKKVIERDGILGAYVDGELAGYISWHSERSMGMLEVFEKFRNRGVATALMAKCVNTCLDEGRIPFAHIIYGNYKSYNLMVKLGFTFSKDLVYWVE